MRSDRPSPDVLVVGAGVLGLFTALFAARMGARVSVIEAHCIGAGASGHSGALIRSNCQTAAESRLAQRSLQVFQHWPDMIGGDAGFRRAGLLEVVDQAGENALRRRVEAHAQLGIGVQLIDRERAKRLSPLLSCDDIAVAAYQPEAGYCEPMPALRSLYKAACDAGAEFEIGTKVRSLVVEGSSCVGVRTDNGDREAGAVVVAAGTGVTDIVSGHGIEFGLVPCLSTLVVFHASGEQGQASGPAVLDRPQDAWFRPMPDGGLLVGMGLGARSGQGRNDGHAPDIEALRRLYAAAASQRFDISPWAPCRGLWQGTYVASPDDIPLVGRHPALNHLYLAAGDSGGAFKLAPAIGQGLAELIIDGAREGNGLEDLSPARLIKDGGRRPSKAEAVRIG